MGLPNTALIQRKHQCVVCEKVIPAFTTAEIIRGAVPGFAHPSCADQTIVVNQLERERKEQPVTVQYHASAEGSKKERLWALMLGRALGDRVTTSGQFAKRKGMVNLTTTQMARELGLQEHDVTHALYDLKGRGLVAFRESRRARNGSKSPKYGGGIPVGIRIPQDVLKAPTKVNAALLGPDDDEPVAAQPQERASIVSAIPLVEQASDSALNGHIEVEVGPLVNGDPRYGKVSLSEFPAIEGTLKMAVERTKLAEAAAALRAIERHELANLVDEEAGTPSDLEVEVAALVARLAQKGLLEA